MVPTNVKIESWETFNEDVHSVDDESSMTVKGLLEQLNITRDTSDYLWYTTRYMNDCSYCSSCIEIESSSFQLLIRLIFPVSE